MANNTDEEFTVFLLLPCFAMHAFLKIKRVLSKYKFIASFSMSHPLHRFQYRSNSGFLCYNIKNLSYNSFWDQILNQF